MFYKKIRHSLKRAFVLPIRQNKGITVLLFLMITLQSAHLLYEPPPLEASEEERAQLKKDVDAFYNSLTDLKQNKEERKRIRQEKEILAKYDTLTLFPFDPNTATETTLTKVGFTERQIRVIEKYRNKGGKYRFKTDLKRMYALSPVQYQFLEPYIQLPEKKDKKQHTEKKKRNKLEIQPFYFDPNTVSLESLQLLGFSKKQAAAIVKYRVISGGFSSKSDFKKVYVVSDERYNELENYISIPPQVTQTKITEVKNKTIVQKLELNSATKEQLTSINGIGNYYAKLIIKHRKKLGGFITKEQLREIVKIREESFDWFMPYLEVDASAVHPIFINTATFKRMVRHPYLEYEDVKKIVTRRERIGFFTSMQQLVDESILSERKLQKMKPYLKIK